MVIGVLAGLWLGQNAGYEEFAEIISVATGMVFLVFSYILLSLFDRKRKDSQHQESLVQMKEIISGQEGDYEQKN